MLKAIGRVAKWAALVLGVVVLATGVAAYVKLRPIWDEAAAAIVDARARGVFSDDVDDGPLTTLERAFVVEGFDDSWDRKEAPCRVAGDVGRMIADQETIRTHAQLETYVARNVTDDVVDPKHSIRRALVGAAAACQLQRRYSDTQLLRMWLPTVNFGRDMQGPEQAARALFDKDVDDLTIEEAARLAVLARSPNNYRRNPDHWEERARRIAEAMAAETDAP